MMRQIGLALPGADGADPRKEGVMRAAVTRAVGNLSRPRRLAIAAAELFALGGVANAPVATGATGAPGGQPARTCESLTALQLPSTTVDSATAVAATSTVPAHCAVHLTVNNPPSSDAVHVGVFMPLSSWNGRFEGVGGGGFSTRNPNVARSPVGPCPLQPGFASAATDGGHTAFDGSL